MVGALFPIRGVLPWTLRLLSLSPLTSLSTGAALLNLLFWNLQVRHPCGQQHAPLSERSGSTARSVPRPGPPSPARGTLLAYSLSGDPQEISDALSLTLVPCFLRHTPPGNGSFLLLPTPAPSPWHFPPPPTTHHPPPRPPLSRGLHSLQAFLERPRRHAPSPLFYSFCGAPTLSPPLLASPKGSLAPLHRSVPGRSRECTGVLLAPCARPPPEPRASLAQTLLVFQSALPELGSAAPFSPGGNSREKPTRRAASVLEALALLTGAAGLGVAAG